LSRFDNRHDNSDIGFQRGETPVYDHDNYPLIDELQESEMTQMFLPNDRRSKVPEALNKVARTFSNEEEDGSMDGRAGMNQISDNCYRSSFNDISGSKMDRDQAEISEGTELPISKLATGSREQAKDEPIVPGPHPPHQPINTDEARPEDGTQNFDSHSSHNTPMSNETNSPRDEIKSPASLVDEEISEF
jgi:hypothetical protein